jgi:hypothetical protein
MGARRCQSKMAIERDLGQSGRSASVDQTDARNTCVRLANNSSATRFTRRAVIRTRASVRGEHGEGGSVWSPPACPTPPIRGTLPFLLWRSDTGSTSKLTGEGRDTLGDRVRSSPAPVYRPPSTRDMHEVLESAGSALAHEMDSVLIRQSTVNQLLRRPP